MIVEKGTLKSECIFSEDKKHRYILRKEWDRSKPRAMVIMINPSSSNSIQCDLTTMLTINNLSKLDFGSVDILNLYSMVGKLSVRLEREDTKVENMKCIHQSLDKCTRAILAFGSIGKSNKTVNKRINELISSLEAYKDKVYYLADSTKEKLLHPLVPEVRSSWNLVPYFKDNNND